MPRATLNWSSSEGPRISRTRLEARVIIFEVDVDPPGSGSSTYLARQFSGDGRPRLALKGMFK